MRAALLVVSLVVLFGCEDEPEPPPTGETETPESPPEAQATPPPEAPEAETREGFIEAEVDGRMVRAEHLPANGNSVNTRMTLMKGFTGPESEEGFRITFMGIDVRTQEFPTRFERSGGSGSLAAAMRMKAVNYYDAEGHMYTHSLRGEDLECQSFEEGVLRCTFQGDAEGSSDEVEGQSVELRNGRLEVQLGDSAMMDQFMEGTAGAAIDSAQMTIDRTHGMR